MAPYREGSMMEGPISPPPSKRSKLTPEQIISTNNEQEEDTASYFS